MIMPFMSILSKPFGDADLRHLGPSWSFERWLSRFCYFRVNEQQMNPFLQTIIWSILDFIVRKYKIILTWLMHGTNPLYLRQKRSWSTSLKIYQHPLTLNTKIPGNFRPTTKCFSAAETYYWKQRRFGKILADLLVCGEYSA